jgi:hypothetical protein
MAADEQQLARMVNHLCGRARCISRFVLLWCYEQNPGAAYQLAATQRLSWPLPTAAMDPFELMEDILRAEVELAAAG